MCSPDENEKPPENGWGKQNEGERFENVCFCRNLKSNVVFTLRLKVEEGC